ncbi:MAG: hypothetical protein KGY55_00395 [Candidatus Thermoplasmatota archaeon]|nr:hypothetical protein [Candidatus Thermoplasmatota archaeon]
MAQVENKLGISEDVIADTDSCRKNFTCLDPETRAVCPVEQRIMDVLFVEPDDNFFCPYKTSFGDSYVCGCPTRQELYAQHRI